MKGLLLLIILAFGISCEYKPYKNLGGYAVVSNQACQIRYLDEDEKWVDTSGTDFHIEFDTGRRQLLKIKVTGLGDEAQELFVGVYEDRSCIEYKQGIGQNQNIEIRN